jgi:hypothetical protein
MGIRRAPVWSAPDLFNTIKVLFSFIEGISGSD